jgi:uncharacterized protein (TIGR02284 family)
MPRDLAILQHLRAVMCDAVADYWRASERAGSLDLKTALMGLSAARAGLMSRLNDQIAGKDGMILIYGTVAGELHRLWLDFTTAFAGGDKAVVRRVRKGERYLVRQLERALTVKALSAPTRKLLDDLLATLRRDAVAASY